MSEEIEEKIITRLVERRYVLPGTDILHREDGPALTRYHPNGAIWEEEHHTEGVRHREGGPAWTSWSPEGYRQWEAYYHNGEMHRDDGPAYVVYRTTDGEVESEDFYQHGRKQPEAKSPKGGSLKDRGALSKAFKRAGAARKASSRKPGSHRPRTPAR